MKPRPLKPIKRLKPMKVLVGTPHNEVKNYCFDKWIANVKTFTYNNYDVFISDNSESRRNMKMIKKHGVNVDYVKQRGRVNQKFIADSHEQIREFALRNDFDFLLHLESDVFPPKDVIERLLLHQLPVVSAPYFIDEGHESRLMVQLMEDKGQLLRLTQNIKGGRDINIMDGKLHKVFACGLGCTLIHKDILKKIKFRWEEGFGVHPDTFFAFDLDTENIPQYIDTSFMCDHQNSKWSKVLNVHQ